MAPSSQGSEPAQYPVRLTDPAAWDFWVVSARTLDEKLSTQKSVGCASLDRLGERIGWYEIKATVDHLID